MTLPPMHSMAVWKLMRVRVEGWKNMRASMRSSKRSILLRLNSSSSLQTCSARLLAARLSHLDPPAYFNPPYVEWPKAHMAFFVFEDVPRTICWYKA